MSGQTPPPQERPPGAVHAGRYGQQAGGTHTTGMHTCYIDVNIHPVRVTLLYIRAKANFFAAQYKHTIGFSMNPSKATLLSPLSKSEFFRCSI